MKNCLTILTLGAVISSCNAFVPARLGRCATTYLSSSATTDQQETFRDIFLHDTPLLDVRAGVEFTKGAFPTSVNMPLLDDEQRALVGTCYKENGQDAAILLGHELLTPDLKQERLEKWVRHVEKNPQGYLYCFRGGLRSKLTQQALKQAGIDYPIVQGGYKAMRTFLMEELDRNVEELPIVMIGGRTASGKTHLLHELTRQVDLEGLANHRGSTFGRVSGIQPAQIDFENNLSIELLKRSHASKTLPVFIEDEGRRIGDRVLPHSLHTAMAERYPLIMLEVSMEERVKTCIDDYVTTIFPSYQERFGEQAYEKFGDKYLAALGRLQKKLGGDRYQVLREMFTKALTLYEQHGDETSFNDITEVMLRDFYDPMYDYQANKREGEVLFRGDRQAVIEFAEQYTVQSAELVKSGIQRG